MAASGLRLERLRGADLKPAHWDAFYRFYRNTTGARLHAQQQLTCGAQPLWSLRLLNPCLRRPCRRCADSDWLTAPAVVLAPVNGTCVESTEVSRAAQKHGGEVSLRRTA